MCNRGWSGSCVRCCLVKSVSMTCMGGCNLSITHEWFCRNVFARVNAHVCMHMSMRIICNTHVISVHLLCIFAYMQWAKPLSRKVQRCTFLDCHGSMIKQMSSPTKPIQTAIATKTLPPKHERATGTKPSHRLKPIKTTHRSLQLAVSATTSPSARRVTGIHFHNLGLHPKPSASRPGLLPITQFLIRNDLEWGGDVVKGKRRPVA